MIIIQYSHKINISDPDYFRKKGSGTSEFERHYNATAVLSWLRKNYPDYEWSIHAYVSRSFFIGSVRYEITVVRVKCVSGDGSSRTHVALPSFLVPYARTCAAEILASLGASENSSGDEKLFPHRIAGITDPPDGAVRRYFRKRFSSLKIITYTALARLAGGPLFFPA